MFFAVVLFIAFLPISSFLFFLKNDAFNGYFPPKFFMSESIHSGFLPLWNPYINYGIPQYGDMSSGYWSPITWLVASTVGYNAYTLTTEVLLYILLGGLGMYQLTGYWKLNRTVRIIAGLSFMCSGFTIGHLQHFNWLSGAAFLPWSLYCFLQLQQHYSFKKAVTAALSFYMFIASAHPGIIISAVYFFIAVMLFVLFKKDDGLPLQKKIFNAVKHNSIFIALLLLLCAGMIIGYADILPHFVRSEKISLSSSLSNPTNLQSWVSILFPLSTVKNDSFFNTDISMRNCYFGLLLFIFFIIALTGKKTSWQKFLLGTGIVFALLSSGGIFKTFAYKFIPLIGYVRLNGEFRIFSMFCFIVVAAISLNQFFEQKDIYKKKTAWILNTISIVTVITVITFAFIAIIKRDSIIFRLTEIMASAGLPGKLKAAIDGLSFYDCLWIQGLVQLALLLLIKYSLGKDKAKLLIPIVVADIVIASLLNIPFTGAGKASVKDVQAVLNTSPHGIPAPAMQPLAMNDTLTTDAKGLVGDWSMYNKQIGTKEAVPYPIALHNMNAYFELIKTNPRKAYADQPFLFVSGDSSSQLILEHYSPNSINVKATCNNNCSLVLKQNYYPHWFYSDGQKMSPIDSFGISFMQAPLHKGTQTIRFEFDPAVVKWAMLISLALFITYAVLAVFIKTKPPDLS
ncbi:MAG: hypothetical protein JST86_06065 [Bacteroidetes bacterium]|nr:hypothetical protein [Bacteroidota bacterium]